MRKRWSPWRAAIWGAGAGVLAVVGALTSRGNVPVSALSDAQLAGQLTINWFISI
jgi:hypothetical protein